MIVIMHIDCLLTNVKYDIKDIKII